LSSEAVRAAITLENYVQLMLLAMPNFNIFRAFLGACITEIRGADLQSACFFAIDKGYKNSLQLTLMMHQELGMTPKVFAYCLFEMIKKGYAKEVYSRISTYTEIDKVPRYLLEQMHELTMTMLASEVDDPFLHQLQRFLAELADPAELGAKG
jgi:hypothetical protein